MPSTEQAETAPRVHDQSRVAAARRSLGRGARLLSRASVGLLVRSFKVLLVVYFAFCLLFLLLRYVVLPNIDQYKSNVEQVATRVVGRPVTIGTIHASWHGLHPQLTLNNVVIFNRTGDAALSLPRVSATISWWSVAVANLRLNALEIIRPDLEIERDAEGSLFVGGIYIDPDNKGDGSGLDWLLQQKQIVIRDGSLRWRDATRQAPELLLTHMTAVIENDWLTHRVAIRATPPQEAGSPIDMRARFSHSPFARLSDVSSWTGLLYVDWADADLAQGKPWVDYPVRAWLSFDHATVVDLTADLGLSNLSTRLRPDLEMLHLTRVQGRVAAGETLGTRADKLFWYGRRGHTVALTDFSFETRDGLTLPPTTISEHFIEASGSRPASTQVQLSSVDLEAMASFASRLPLSQAQRQMISDFAPAGKLSDFSAKWQGVYPDIKSYQLKGNFADLRIRPQPARPATSKTRTEAARLAVPGIPGFSNLTGAVDLNEKGGTLKIHAQDASLALPGLLPVPELDFEELDMNARWTVQENNRFQFIVTDSRFLHEGMRGNMTARYSTTVGGNKATDALELQAQLDQVDVRDVGLYLPLRTSVGLNRWLTGALQEGKLNDVNVVVKGNLADFPYRTTRPGEKPKGQFTVSAQIEKGKLDYAPGALAATPAGSSAGGAASPASAPTAPTAPAPSAASAASTAGTASTASTASANSRARQLWPSIENINGRLLIDRTRLEVRGDKAQSHGVALSNVLVTIPDLLAASPMLSVNGTAQGALQDLLGFTVDSPVSGWTGKFTEESRATGNAKLLLDLQLPLTDMVNAKVKGTVQFAGNDVTLMRHMPPMLRTTGELRFHEKGFELAGVRANFLGGPVGVSGGTQRDGNIALRAEGTASIDGVRRAYPTPVMERLVRQMSGGARYAVQINVRNKRPEIILESSLQGIALDFPVPLRKAANDILPLRLELGTLASDRSGAQRDEIKASLGSTINALYQRRKGTATDASWEVVAGGIGVNVPAPQPESGLIVKVSLRALDLDAWRIATAAIIERAPATTSATGAPAAAGDKFNLEQYFDPDVLAARATELTVANKKLQNVVVGASQQNDLWQANIESDQVSGYLSWAESRSGRGSGRVTARLVSLIIPPSAAGNVSELLDGKGVATRIPALDVVAENFELFGKKFGRLELNANNTSTPSGREWRINKLAVANGDATMLATGRYQSRDGKSDSTLNYSLDIVDAGRLLDRLGFQRVLRGGRGKMSGEVSWSGLPFSIDIPSLSGQLTLDLTAGQFLKVDPGAAKLLGVLSLQSLPRRLVLDFRDVFSEGFVFDGVTAAATISKGVMNADNFKMRSVSAAVLMSGNIDLVRESQNIRAVVIPEINAGAASVAYGLMVNPVLGIGSFLAQLFLRDPLMRAFTVEYDITGPWKDPVIRKVARANANGDSTSNSNSQGSSDNSGAAVSAPVLAEPAR